VIKSPIRRLMGRLTARTVTVTFEERGAKTMMALRHNGFESKPAQESHHGGWTGCIARSARYMSVAG
jgi:hypothetical protein